MIETRNKPVVSVCMITYNHEPYIAEVIEGVLMQQTDFPIELIIGEDCSTDRTREICIEYQRKHPDIIRLLLNESNLGMISNFAQSLQACRGKYIALCDGDDYWSDPLKLQKQVDFLEANEEFAGIHSKVVYVDRQNNVKGYSNRVKPGFESISFEALIQRNIIHTCSFVFRLDSLLFNGKYLWEYTPVFHDIFLFLGVSLRGKIKYLNELTSAYRTNVGIMQTLTKEHIHKDAISYHNFFLTFEHISINDKASILFSLVNRQMKLLLILLKQKRKAEAWKILKNCIGNYRDFINHKRYLNYRMIKIDIKQYLLAILWLFFTDIMYYLSKTYNKYHHVSHRRNRPGA